MTGARLLLQARDAIHTVPLDTVIVESPAPAIQPLFDFLLNMSAPIQRAGAVIGLLVLAAAAWYVWRRRTSVSGWLRTRPRGAQIALAASAIGAVVIVAAAGAWTYDYVEHENAFCNSCHIMNDAYMRFSGSEHAELGCHDCHRQPLTTSMRQLVLWVAERPDEIPPHSPVPSGICGECHVDSEPDSLWMTEEAWRHVDLTAGHVVHLESDNPDLADIECTSCHGVRVHSFIPVESTCLSSGCHDGLEIQLGRMASAPVSFHCSACHEFTAPAEPRGAAAPATAAAPDSAAAPGVAAAGDSAPAPGAPASDDLAIAAHRAISPDMEQCYSCHVMEQVLPRAQVAADPHNAACGMCHNPHTQVAVAEAGASCGTAGCHESVEDLTPFHRGLHAATIDNCTRCHRAHEFRVDGSNCLSCHRDILSAGDAP